MVNRAQYRYNSYDFTTSCVSQIHLATLNNFPYDTSLRNMFCSVLLENTFCCVLLDGLPYWVSGKESACQCRRLEFDPWVKEIHWRKKWQATPVFLPGKSHGQRILEGYLPSMGFLKNRYNLVTKQQQQTCYLKSQYENNVMEGFPEVFCSAAAAAKSLQSCPTLCDPIDDSPPGSPIPGILQARTLEWVAISFSNV